MTEPCEHVLALIAHLKTMGLAVWSEHGEPDGWVNVACGSCHRTFEVVLAKWSRA